MHRRFYLLLPVILLMLVPVANAQEASPTPEILLETTQESVAEATSEPLPPANAGLPLLVSARTDLELLANTTLGNDRPIGWTGNFNINDPQLVVSIRLDLELLAATLLGVNNRPTGWFGAVPSTSFAIARDVRHDLELLADTLIQPSVRPPGWSGADPIMRCNRATQSLVTLLERNGFILQADPNSADFCAQAEIQASRFVESSTEGAASPSANAIPAGSIEVTSDSAVVFLDRNARQRAGVMPRGVALSPVARSYVQFSNMMVVRGSGFEVFIDYTFTSITSDQFETLPDVNNVPVSISCAAEWCD